MIYTDAQGPKYFKIQITHQITYYFSHLSNFQQVKLIPYASSSYNKHATAKPSILALE